MKKALQGGRYRVVEIVEKRLNDNDVETCVFACYIGSSNFDKKQLSDFVETILHYAGRIGLEITYYSNGLRRGPYRKQLKEKIYVKQNYFNSEELHGN